VIGNGALTRGGPSDSLNPDRFLAVPQIRRPNRAMGRAANLLSAETAGNRYRPRDLINGVPLLEPPPQGISLRGDTSGIPI
jgi:hypothetical protein